MRLMILENKRLRTTLQAGPGMISIGSSPECGVHLPDPKLPAHQASLTQDEEGAWWLEVVDPSVPTCLNRAIQRGRAKLRHADEIEMGLFSIRLFMESKKTRDEIRRERMQALSRQHGETLPLGALIQKFDDGVQVSKEHLEQITLLALRLEQTETVQDLMPPLLRALLRTFDARRAWVGIRKTDEGDFDWSLAAAANGQPCERPSLSRNMELRCLAHTQYVCVPEASAAGVGSAMAVPLVCQAGNLGILYVENDPEDAHYGEEALHALSAVSCSIGMPIENVLRKVVAKRRQTATTEQMVARLTQDAVTPKALPQWDNLLLAAYRHMGSAHCSDFYDVVQLRDKTAAILLARVAAQGEVLSRYLAEMRAAFRTAALYSEPPHLFARALNWVIYDGDSRQTIDFACVWVAPESGKVHYCAAGAGVHIGRIRADGGCERVEAPEMPPIGRTRAPAFTCQTIDLGAGETLVLATEGVNSAVDARQEVFGWEGLKENLCDGLGDTPGTTLSELAKDLTEFLQGGSCPDDLTVLLVQRP